MNFPQTLSFLSMSLPMVQDDSLCTPIITWNSLTPPYPKQYFLTHRLRFKTPLKHLKSQVIGQEICLNAYTNASFEWLTKTLVGHCTHTVVVATWTEKMLSPLLIWAPQLEEVGSCIDWLFSADRIDRDKPVMIFAETLLLFLWKIRQTENSSWQQPSLFFFNRVIIFQ